MVAVAEFELDDGVGEVRAAASTLKAGQAIGDIAILTCSSMMNRSRTVTDGAIIEPARNPALAPMATEPEMLAVVFGVRPHLNLTPRGGWPALYRARASAYNAGNVVPGSQTSN